MSRITVIVLDSLGVGALPDADKFGDAGANTLKHIKEDLGKLNIPNLVNLGLYNIDGTGLESEAVANPLAAYGKMNEQSKAKDTTTGHFEMTGLIMEEPYKIFMDGFPERITKRLEEKIGRKLIGNFLVSGTEVIKQLGQEHVQTGSPIIYTSADSLMQIAMHEQVIPLKEQYNICMQARNVLMGDDTVARVICRPFVGNEKDGFTRTENRKDFSIDPPGKTILDHLKAANKDVIAVGKLKDIFNNNGITLADHTKNNAEGIQATLKYLKTDFDGFLFVNLVDFDMLYGHRRDALGYGKALEHFDAHLPEILGLLKDDDILIITADHGCDPTYLGTDHTREYIPLLVCGNEIKAGTNMHVRDTFADIAATIAQKFDIKNFNVGKSFLNEVTK